MLNGVVRAFRLAVVARGFSLATILLSASLAGAQTAAAQMPRMTFEEAVRLAMDRNPTVAEAATSILRAEALLQQSRAVTRPNVGASATNVLINSERGFEGIVAQPRNQLFLGVNVSVPLLAASQWAATAQAKDQIEVAKLSVAEVRQHVAVAAAEAYLVILAASRQVDVNARSRESAQAHLDYADRRLAAGAGTRLNQLRAAQQVSSDAARLEIAQLAVRRAQEALGVLVAANGPVDINGEPVFALPPIPDAAASDSWLSARPDVQLSTAALSAAQRVVDDSSKDWFPRVTASFDPQMVAPAGSFSPTGSWSFTISASQPIFDSGERRAAARLREAAAESSKQSLTAVQIQARSDVRLADETVRSNERTLASLQLAARQAADVLTITTTAFEAGATTNLEVIDAQRSARDADSAATIAEDAVRHAKLDLLVAVGQFPPP